MKVLLEKEGCGSREQHETHWNSVNALLKKKKKKRENANANTFINIQTLPYKIILVSTHFDVELKVHI